MSQQLSKGRRYSAEEKAAAVRMVRTLRAELGSAQGTAKRVCV
jgi:transposase